MAQVNDHVRIMFKLPQAMTFDEVTFEDRPSAIHPSDVILTSKITTKYSLKSAGIMSSAMDTVTEKEMALAIAKMGGLGIIHRNMSIDEQCQMVKWVRNKIHFGCMIDKPVCYKATNKVSDIENDIKSNGWTFTNFPILDDDGSFLGMVSRNELKFVELENPLLSGIMIPLNKVITTSEINKELAYKIMKDHKVKKLPVIDKDNKFVGLYAWNDIRKDNSIKELFSLDEDGHFLVGAAVGSTLSERERIAKLVESKCKIIVIDTSHGANTQVIEMLIWVKTTYSELQVIIGNIASFDSAKFILESCGQCEPDAIKVGISCGSICTTRRVTGHGMPQLTAIYQVWSALKVLKKEYIPIIADGGIRHSGDIVKAFAVGASSVMLGNVFAGCEESPGKVIVSNGQKFKTVRGMGSKAAMQEKSGSRMRYFNTTADQQMSLTNNQKVKVVPEGIEGYTKLSGSVENKMTELLGGIKSGFAHSGSNNIEEFRQNCRMWVQSAAGIAEGNPHSLEKILD
jgi:IMP dehydrogenase